MFVLPIDYKTFTEHFPSIIRKALQYFVTKFNFIKELYFHKATQNLSFNNNQTKGYRTLICFIYFIIIILSRRSLHLTVRLAMTSSLPSSLFPSRQLRSLALIQAVLNIKTTPTQFIIQPSRVHPRVSLVVSLA